MPRSQRPAGGFALPDEIGYVVADFEPGRYIAVSFIPVGATAEVIENDEELEGEPDAYGIGHYAPVPILVDRWPQQLHIAAGGESYVSGFPVRRYIDRRGC